MRDVWDGFDLIVSDSNGVILFFFFMYVFIFVEIRKKECNEEFVRCVLLFYLCFFVSGKFDDEGFW